MVSDEENEKEDLNSYFDDDSSVEEELLRVAEKLEAMSNRQKEEKEEEILFVNSIDLQINDNVDDPPYLSPSNHDHFSESTFSNCPTNLSPATGTSMETNLSREVIAKHIIITSNSDSNSCCKRKYEENFSKNSDIKRLVFIDNRNCEEERSGQQQQHAQHIVSCSRKNNQEVSKIEASIDEAESSTNTYEDQMPKQQESNHPESRQHLEKKQPQVQPQKQRINASIKSSKVDNEVFKIKDAKSLNKYNYNGANNESFDSYNSAFDKKIVLTSGVDENKAPKEVVINRTNMEITNTSTNSYNGNHSEINSLSVNCTSTSTSSSSLSDDAAEIIGQGSTDKKDEDTHDYIRRSDFLHQRKIQDNSVPVMKITKAHENYEVNHTNDASFSGIVAASSNDANASKLSKIVEISSGTLGGIDQTSHGDNTSGSVSSKKLTIATTVLRNPYLRMRNASNTSVNATESALTHDFGNQHPLQWMNNTNKKVVSVNNNVNSNDDKTPVLEPESSNKKMTARPSRNLVQSKREEEAIDETDELDEESESEVVLHSLFCAPIFHEGRPSTTIHKFNYLNHPLHSRQSIPVASLNRRFTSTIVNALWAQKFDCLNHFQSVMVNTLSDSDDNVVVSAPTGAGKSTLFEMAMARFLTVDLRAQERQCKISNSTCSLFVSKARKMLYIAPSKALCEERYSDWSQRLKSMNLGLEIALITGQESDSEQATKSFSDLIAAQLIVTTPEKWDSITRRWSKSFFLFASIKLLLVDEVHLLGNEGRGWCLESILTRMKTIQRSASAFITTSLEINSSSYSETNPTAISSCFRTVVVSATLPNILEVADFFQADDAYSFDDSYRPIPLTKHVNAMGWVGKNEWRFWSNLSEHVPEIVKRFSHGKQSLIFCHSKKETQKVTDLLIRKNFGTRGNRIADPPWNEPVEYMIRNGIGYHHAGMSRDERKTIEEAFLSKKIKCLAATSTLAVGVNLPAHLVIIVGTKAWRNNEKGKGYQDIEVSALLQMIGRAGRPGLDSTGVAVVLTDNSSKKRIEEQLEAGIGPAKSNLIPRLPEVLNTEISQRVITNMDEVLLWLQTTFFFSCFKDNADAIEYAKKISNDAIAHLRDIGMVRMNEKHSIYPLAGSFIMNRHMVSFEEMKTISEFPFDVSQCQILRSMSKLENLQSFVKRNEKRELKEFHKSDLMKYKLPGSLSKFIVRDPSEKAFILLQSHISRHRYKNESLNDEQTTVRDEAIKFLEVAQEYCVKASKHGKVVLECYKLQRSLNCSLWDESSGVFNQFKWIGSSKTASKALTFNGIRSFEDVLNCSEQKLDDILAKIQIPDLPENAGRIMKHTVHDLCRRRLILSTNIEYTKNSNIPSDLICSLKCHIPSVTLTRVEGEQNLKFSLIVYTDNSENSSLLFEGNICSPSSFRVPLPPKSYRKLFIRFVGTWVGFDQTKIIDDMNAMVSSHRKTVGTSQYSKARNYEICAPVIAKTKKRKSFQTEVPYFTNQRQSEKLSCIAQDRGMKPSPITPQTVDKNPGITHASITNKEQSLGKFWEEKKETYDDIQPTMLPRTPGHSTPVTKPQIQKTSISINVTPTTRMPTNSNFCHERSSSCMNTRRENLHQLPSNCVYQKFVPFKQHGNSRMPDLEKCYRTNADGQDILSNSEMYPLVLNESAAATSATETEGITKFACEERKRQSDERSPLKTSRKGNIEMIIWKTSRTKQQRAQKRAFTEKKMNPFRTFSHDPNDFESHLQKLSQQSSIIPNPLLAKMKQSSIMSNRKSKRYFSTDQNRRARKIRHRYSSENPQHVLREKASEQQFQHENIISRRQSIPKPISSQYSLQENYSTQSSLSVNVSQDNRRLTGRSGYQQNFERRFQFPHSSITSETQYLPVVEGTPRITGRNAATLNGHQQTYSGIFGNHLCAYQLPQGSELQTLEEYDQNLRTQSFGSSQIDVETQSQHQHLHRGQQLYTQISQPVPDVESEFHYAFY